MKNNIKTKERGGNRGGRLKGKGCKMSKGILDYRDKVYGLC